MKRLHLHVHVAVDDVEKSIGFYAALFAAGPVVVKSDYAKWMLEDPRMNFAISARGRSPGLDHLGIQVENKEELEDVYARLEKAGGSVLIQGETSCCYAKSEKSWTADPAGIAWETFFTMGESTVYDSADLGPIRTTAGACCAPETPQGTCCAMGSAHG